MLLTSKKGNIYVPKTNAVNLLDDKVSVPLA